MLINYIKIAFRNLIKNKFTSAVNLLGLIVGMTAAILIWQYVAYEKSYDDFHENADRIVRVQTDRIKDGEVFLQFAAGTAGAGPVIHRNFAEVENYVKLFSADGIYTNDSKFFKEENAYFASNSFFDIFTSPLLVGDQKNCLVEPYTVCLSESIAKKYFGTTDPVGKFIQKDGNTNYKITGVFADWQDASHMKPEILLSYTTYIQNNIDNETETSAYSDGYYAYLLLKEGTDVKDLEAKIPTALAATYEEGINDEIALLLQPLNDIHLNSHVLSEMDVNGDATAVRFLLIIGGIMLLIAWFNYLNLATARSTTRAREVGVRKVIGSSRGSLIRQFLMETALLNIIAIAASLFFVQLLMPAFETLAGKSISFSVADNPNFWLGLIGLFLVGTLLVGVYPALVLSSFRPSEALSGHKGSRQGAGGSLVRKTLVVAQFAASVILIVGTLIIFQQLSHLQETDLGININQTLVLHAPEAVDSTFHGKFDAFKKEVRQLAAVNSISASSEVPGAEVNWTAAIKKWGGDDDSYEGMQAIAIDPEWAKQYDLEIVAGRLPSQKIITDLNAVILNEKGVQRMNLGSPEEAIGVDLNFWDSQVKVIGVVKNFHQQSPKMTFAPLIMRLYQPTWTPDYISINIKKGKAEEVINFAQSKWLRFFDGNPFSYFFLDDRFAEQYEADQRLGQLIAIFAGLAIFVSCLGLFALAAFIAERRTKEIGIRKVLGASVENLVSLLSKEFLILVGVAIIIAIPLAYFVMNKWLDSFVMRIDLEWWVFLLAGAIALGIGLLTVGFNSLKAAMANPVESIKME